MQLTRQWEDDVTLWQSFVEGDRRAYACIYEKYAKEMYRYCMHFTENEDQIEDAIHDLFVYIFTKRKNLKKVKNIKAFLFVSVRNEIFKKGRLANLEFRLDAVSGRLLTDGENMEMELIRQESRMETNSLLKELESLLTPREKEAIYYRFSQQLSFRYISEIMNIKEQSAKNLISNSIQKMRAQVNLPTIISLTYCLQQLSELIK